MNAAVPHPEVSHSGSHITTAPLRGWIRQAGQRLSIWLEAFTAANTKMTASGGGHITGLAAVAVLCGAVAAGMIWYLAWSPYAAPDMSAVARSWVSISAAIFLAASISSTVGFAFSAIAAAMILHLVPNNVEAVQIMLTASIGLQMYSVAGLLRTISWRGCAPFLFGGAAALPLGLALLLNVHPQLYIFAIGVTLTLYGAFMLFRRPLSIRKGGALINAAVGALGGITGPLAAFPGAFVTIWCGMRGWDKITQRSIYQPYILVMQVLTLAGLSAVSERAPFHAELLTYALPGAAGAYLGLHVFHRLSDMQFHRLVSLALVASGFALVLKS